MTAREVGRLSLWGTLRLKSVTRQINFHNRREGGWVTKSKVSRELTRRGVETGMQRSLLGTLLDHSMALFWSPVDFSCS